MSFGSRPSSILHTWPFQQNWKDGERIYREQILSKMVVFGMRSRQETPRMGCRQHKSNALSLFSWFRYVGQDQQPQSSMLSRKARQTRILMWIERCWFAQTRERNFPNVEAALPMRASGSETSDTDAVPLIQGSRTFQQLLRQHHWWLPGSPEEDNWSLKLIFMPNSVHAAAKELHSTCASAILLATKVALSE